MHGQHYLFLSEDRGPDSRLGSTPRVESTLYVMGPDGHFITVQTLPTDGAHAAEHFSAGGQDFLAIANFGDRLGSKQAGVLPRYEALSSLWQWDVAKVITLVLRYHYFCVLQW